MPPVKLDHPPLVDLLKKAYSAEKAAAFAYIGHANSLGNPETKAAVKQIENDEWHHRDNVLEIMRQYDIPVSRYYEVRFHIIGKIISMSCHVIGWFMPYFFAGRLESGNVCEYFVMLRYFESLGISEHNKILYEMGIKEKEHEVYFLEQIKSSKWLPIFERIFSWGAKSSRNDVDLENKYSIENAGKYCKTYKPGSYGDHS
jgi:rubrerythrin